MIPKECKRLAEVDFPIAEVGKHALAEKAMRMGTPHQLHLWWAWRPLASSRALLIALLLPDPCDKRCPQEFKKHASEILGEVRQKPKSDKELQKALLWFIGAFSNWSMSSNSTYLRVARNLVRAGHPEDPPLVMDPFAGGGSIPLEAIRVGCETFASDLNSVACLILQAKLKSIQRYGAALTADLERAGAEIRRKAELELTGLYPEDPDGAIPIAYLWARTVRCEAPNCGAEIPLIRSFWLSKKPKRRRALKPLVVGDRRGSQHVEFEIFEPGHGENPAAATVTRAKATCLCCLSVLSPDRVCAQLAVQRGGADVIFDKEGQRSGGARMTAVVTLRPGETGRHFRLSVDSDYEPARRAQEQLADLVKAWREGGEMGPCPEPDESLPPIGTLGFRVQRYGMLAWRDLFTARQTLSLITLARHAGSLEREHARELVALCVSKLAERNNSICDWMVDVECPGHLFTQQVIPPAWDFAEAAPFGGSSGSFKLVVESTARSAAACEIDRAQAAEVDQLDAADTPLPEESVDVYFTDPPYYDAVPYSDLSDFFFVWLKRVLPKHTLLRDRFDPSNGLTSKVREIVQDRAKIFDEEEKDASFFESRMAVAFGEGRKVLKPQGVGCIVFAHKTTEGWEALLSGMINAGWVVTGSWPIATERSARMRARDSAALSTSVHLICRPRLADAPVGDWADVLRELPKRVATWMERLQSEGIRGADLVFACIGPALEIFSRYSVVVDPEERLVPLGGDPEAKEAHARGYLAYVWEVVGRAALEQVLGSGQATSGSLEEDARLTALFLWTLQSTEAPEENGKKKKGDTDVIAKAAAKGFSLPFDVVRRFAQPMGIDLAFWTDRIIEQKKGVVRLLPVAERAEALFGDDGARGAADWLEASVEGDLQGMLFADMPAGPKKKARGRVKKSILSGATELQSRDATTLDRVHAAMLLQASGQANALRKLLQAEQDRGPDFLRLRDALVALYPKGSEEKRLLEAMRLAALR